MNNPGIYYKVILFKVENVSHGLPNAEWGREAAMLLLYELEVLANEIM